MKNTMLKTICVQFVDALLHLYSDTSPLIISKILRIRHAVRHVISEDELNQRLKMHLDCGDNRRHLTARDFRFFFTERGEYNFLVELVWVEMKMENRNVIWQWVDKIFGHVSCEDEHQ